MIRVAHVATTLNVGGAEQLLLDLCGRFSEHDVHATVTYLKGAGPMAEEFRAIGVDVAKVGLLAPIDPTAVPRLAGRLHAVAPDIVHTHMFKADLHGALAAARAGVPHLISTKHAAEEARASAAVAAVDRWLARRSDTVVAVSKDMGRFTAGVEGMPAASIRVIVNGVSLDRLVPKRDRAAVRSELGVPSDAPVVLSTSRFHPSKGHAVLLEAMRIVRAELPEARLVLVGDGEERGLLHGLAAADGSAVVFTGTRRDLPDLLAAADCYALPSLREGLGLAVVEAMAMGRACVATTAGALPEVITDGVDGLLVPPGESGPLAQALLRVLTDRELAARLGQRATHTARERFDVRRTAAEYAALYREVAASPR